MLIFEYEASEFREAKRGTVGAIGSASSWPGAVITLGYVLLGERATELVSCDVRHFDDGWALLWLPGTKTDAVRRQLIVPHKLRPLLLALAADRPGHQPLFFSVAARRWPAGRRLPRTMAYYHARRLCRAAGVPEIDPQGLLRTQVTIATEAGETGLAVVGRAAAKQASVERGLVVLRGGRR